MSLVPSAFLLKQVFFLPFSFAVPTSKPTTSQFPRPFLFLCRRFDQGYNLMMNHHPLKVGTLTLSNVVNETHQVLWYGDLWIPLHHNLLEVPCRSFHFFIWFDRLLYKVVLLYLHVLFLFHGEDQAGDRLHVFLMIIILIPTNHFEDIFGDFNWEFFKFGLLCIPWLL